MNAIFDNQIKVDGIKYMCFMDVKGSNIPTDYWQTWLVFSTHQRVVALTNRDLDREVLQLMQFLSMVKIKGLKKKQFSISTIN